MARLKPFRFASQWRRVAIGTLLLAAAVSALGADATPTAEDSARLRAKVDAIARNAELPTPSPLLTQITEREVNAYFAFDGRPHLPAGLADPRIVIQRDLSLLGTATLDLDAVRQQRQSRGWLDPLAYLSGKMAVSVSGRLESANGLARFLLDSAKIGGITVPKVVVQELLTFYSKSPSSPRGLNLDDPYPLPAHIRRIDVRRGEALVTQ
jgi:hypothetical protein